MQFEKIPYRQVRKNELLYNIGISGKRSALAGRFFHVIRLARAISTLQRGYKKPVVKR